MAAVDATRITVASLVGPEDLPLVQITIAAVPVVLDVTKARELATLLPTAAEAAVADAVLARFLQAAGCGDAEIATALRACRTLRQGTSEPVYPS